MEINLTKGFETIDTYPRYSMGYKKCFQKRGRRLFYKGVYILKNLI